MSVFFNPMNLGPYPHNDDYHNGNASRAAASGVAGLYACKTILNEHRPVCTGVLDLTTGMLNPSTDANRWTAVPNTTNVTYSGGELTVAATTGAGTIRRLIYPRQLPYDGNFLEISMEITDITLGEGLGQSQEVNFGFADSFADRLYSSPINCVGFRHYIDDNEILSNRTRLLLRNPADGLLESVYLDELEYNANIVTGDIITVRLGRNESSADIDKARFYVNGTLVYECDAVFTGDMYPGIQVYNSPAASVAGSISTRYVGIRWVP